MKRAEDGQLDPELRDALHALRQEHRSLEAPAEVERRVMREWDDAHAATLRPRESLGGRMLEMAAALMLAVAVTVWWRNGGQEPASVTTAQPAVAAPWPSDETLAWLGAEPASLQVVRIRVDSTALAQHGYAVSDPDGDGLVDVEMIVGTDGIAQTVRLSPTTVVVE